MNEPLEVDIPRYHDDPNKCVVKEYHWYRTDCDTQGFSFNSTERITKHWLSAGVFDRLLGGELSPTMGIRKYATKAEAMDALRRVGK